MEIPESRLGKVALNHNKSFKARFPMLQDIEMENVWGGRLCLSQNSVPAFGEITEGIYSANCQNGLGTVKGTLSGMMAAELAAGMKSPLLTELQSLAIPKSFPQHP